MKTLIKISIMVAVFCVYAAFAAETFAPLRAKIDTSATLLGKDVSYARLVRVTMKDGSVEEFLVESVKTLTFLANPNDSSNIDEDEPSEDPEIPDEPDRTPEHRSSDSKGDPSSSSVEPDEPSSSSVEPSSSSVTPDKPSSSSKGGDGSGDGSDEPSSIPNINYAGAKIAWNSRHQTLSIFSRQSGNAKFSVVDVQGAVLGSGNVFVSRGSTSVSLDYLDLPKGNFVIKFEMGSTKLQQPIAVTGK